MATHFTLLKASAITQIQEDLENAVASDADRAEAARDIAEGYTSDAVSQGNVPIYASVVTVEGQNIPPGISALRTNGYYVPGDGGGALYKRVASEPSHAGKIQSADGAWWELGEAVVNVLQFGAKRDAVPGLDTGTDDSAAFNALADYLRPTMYGADPTNGYRVGVGTIRIVIPPGYYLMENSWDLTDFRRARNITIEGHGAVLIGKTPGYPVVDALDSRWLHFHGLTVQGSIHAPPTCGIQIGKSGTTIAIGNNGFDEVRCQGSYTLAGFANFGSETTTHRRCRYSNEMPDGSGVERFAYVGLGDFFFLPTSQYKAITATEGTPTSFTQNSFYACDFRNNADGSTILLSNSSSHLFDKGCYYVAFKKANVVLEASYTNNDSLTLHGHFENAGISPVTGDTGVEYLIWWRSQGSSRTLRNLSLEASAVHASEFVFLGDNLGSASHISASRIVVPGFHPNSPNAMMFSGMEDIRVQGELWVPNGARLNLKDIASFNGVVYCDNIDNVPNFSSGSYQIFDRTTRPSVSVGGETFGTPNLAGTSLVPQFNTFTPTVGFTEPGDLSVSYDARNGYYNVLPGGLVYIEIVLRFTPTYTTSSGSFYIGNLPKVATAGGLRFGALTLTQAINVVFGDDEYLAVQVPDGNNIARLNIIRNGRGSLLARTDHFPSGTEYTLTVAGLYRSAAIE